MLHGCFGPAFFALCVSLAAFTSRLWRTAPAAKPCDGAFKLHQFALLLTLLVYTQLVLGSQLRHIPVDASPGAFRAAVFSHLILAGVVAADAFVLAWIAWFRHRDLAALRRPALIIATLVFCQLLLGGGTYVVTYFWPNWVSGFLFAASYTIKATGRLQSLTVTAHAAIGSLVFAVSLLVLLRSLRLLSVRSGPLRSMSLSEGLPA
jgi:cytochrome c oxidase assembly protein subunit 15